VISGRCTIFLSLHGQIDPETRKSDPHHAGIKELPAASSGTDVRVMPGRTKTTANLAKIDT
jgi:hypothetical protein